MALRDDIRSEIENITPFDAAERAVVMDALAWIDSGAELYRLAKPATPPKHLVSYFLVVDGDHILMCDHRKSGLWLPTGGHMDPGEHPCETTCREVVEELGVALPFAAETPQFITMSQTVGLTPGHLDVSLWYVVNAPLGTEFSFDAREFKDVRGFAPDAIPCKRTEPELARFLAKRAAGLAV